MLYKVGFFVVYRFTSLGTNKKNMLISIIKPFTCTTGTDCSSFGNMLSFHVFWLSYSGDGSCRSVLGSGSPHRIFIFVDVVSRASCHLLPFCRSSHFTALSCSAALWPKPEQIRSVRLILLYHREASPRPVHWFRPQAPLWASGPPQPLGESHPVRA